MKKLYITEKPNAAKDLAEALGIKKKNDNGFYESIDEDGNVTVIGFAAGHLVRLKEPYEIDIKYKYWILENLPIEMGNEIPLTLVDYNKTLFQKLKKEINAADVIINAGDSGREGELIQRWILKMAKFNKKGNRLYRLWSSSLTKEALLKADQNLKLMKEYDDLYASAEARALMDYILGFNYSRAISLTKTEGVTVSYGRCQSPLLSAIVKRDLEIEHFTPTPFSYVKAQFQAQNGSYEGILVNEEKERKEFANEMAAKEIIQKMDGHGVIQSITVSHKVKNPPKPYDLLNLQKEMAKKFGYDAEKTLDICQKLYATHKVLSYPRTDGEYLTNDLKKEIKDHLKSIEFGEFKPLIEQANYDISDRYFNDKKITDHHALIPTINNTKNIYPKLDEEEKNVFDAVCKRFIALFYDAYEYDAIEIITTCNNNLFKSKGKQNEQKGYAIIYDKDTLQKNNSLDKKEDKETEEETVLPDVQEKESVAIEKTEVKNDKTKPKKRYTTDSLLSLMKMYNIGTGATRANIIKELTVKKGKNKESYVEKKKNQYISTAFGRDIIQLVPEQLKSLDLLGDLENKIKEIEEGNLEKEAFLKQIHQELVANIETMKKESKKMGSKMKGVKKSIQTTEMICPKCQKGHLIEYQKGYGCELFQKDKSCDFFIFKTFGNRKIPKKTIQELVANQKTKEKVEGFTNKAGKKFDAWLVMEDFKVKYKFK